MDAPSLVTALKTAFPQAVAQSHAWRGDATVRVAREFLLAVGRFLKEDPAFEMNVLMDLTAVDYSAFGKKPALGLFSSSGVGVSPPAGIADGDPWPGSGGSRFVVVYHFFSLPKGHRLRLVVPVEEKDPVVDSLATLWAGADWLEREVWDMFGIRFQGHPNLQRLLMYEEFTGHPLRKDYPVNKRQPLIGPMN